jgi:CDP-diacylglycerol--glycerol-3-phosphate 3-phosphatidyltransferase
VSVFDLACSVALAAATLVVAAAYAARVSRLGTAKDARIERAGSSLLLGEGAMEMGYWAMRPAARACMVLGVSANAVSWASLALAAGAGAALALGRFGVAALLSAASSVCDALDGMIAREMGTASDSGEVLDAAVDRYAELFFFGGLAFCMRHDGLAIALVFAATAGATMVSYATAKAEALHVDAPRGAMRRQERAVYLVLAIALVPIVEAASAPWATPLWVARVPVLAGLALVAIVGNASAVRRLRAIAVAVRKPASARAAEPNGAQAIARNAHAATSDALR